MSQTQDAESKLRQLTEFRFRLRQFLSFSEARSEAAGVTVQQYQLLQVVEAGGNAGLSISAVAERLLLRHNSAVELVDRAERAGLVIRTTDASDQRKSLVRLTPAGREILMRLVEEHLVHLSVAGEGIVHSLNPLLNQPAPTTNN